MMSKRQKQIVFIFIALLSLYVGVYVWARITHRIVHVQNRSGGEALVLAKPDPWDDLLVDMSKGKPVAQRLAKAQKGMPTILNTVFWPLRSIESAWWDHKKDGPH